MGRCEVSVLGAGAVEEGTGEVGGSCDEDAWRHCGWYLMAMREDV